MPGPMPDMGPPGGGFPGMPGGGGFPGGMMPYFGDEEEDEEAEAGAEEDEGVEEEEDLSGSVFSPYGMLG